MKKKLYILIVALILLVGCSENDKILSEDFNSDVEQIIPIIEQVHETQNDFTEKEEELFEEFKKKYNLNQYRIKDTDDYYEMNDVEKSIFNEITTMKVFAINFEDDKDKIKLSSESGELDLYEELYEESSSKLEDLLKLKNIDKLPDEFKGKYPTYEVFNTVLPEEFEVDAKELIELFDPIVNGDVSDINDKEWETLNQFLKQYQGDDEYPTEYEQNGKHYLINSQMEKVIYMFSDLKTGIDDDEFINYNTIDDFNSVKETIEKFAIN